MMRSFSWTVRCFSLAFSATLSLTSPLLGIDRAAAQVNNCADPYWQDTLRCAAFSAVPPFSLREKVRMRGSKSGLLYLIPSPSPPPTTRRTSSPGGRGNQKGHFAVATICAEQYCFSTSVATSGMTHLRSCAITSVHV
jgi:hypothetical protein